MWGLHWENPRFVLAVGVDAEHVYVMVAASWPGILQYHIPISGRPVILENGHRRRATVSGPESAHVRQLGNNSPSLAISLSVEDISYLHQFYRNFWAGLGTRRDRNNRAIPGTTEMALRSIVEASQARLVSGVTGRRSCQVLVVRSAEP